MNNRKLTDEEVCRKFGITRDSPNFATARGLSDNRPDRTVCKLPDCMCPHCGHEFTADYEWFKDSEERNGDELIACEKCDRWVYFEFVVDPDVDDFDGDDLYVTLSTEAETVE